MASSEREFSVAKERAISVASSERVRQISVASSV